MWHGRHEDGIGRTVSFHELESCRWLQLQNCIRESTVNHSVLATKEIAVRNSLALWKQNAGLYWPAFPPAHQYKRGQPRSWQWILIYNALVELKSSTIFIYQRLRARVIKFTASNHRFWVEGRAGCPQSNPLLATRAGCSRPCLVKLWKPTRREISSLAKTNCGEANGQSLTLLILRYNAESSSWTAHPKVVLLAPGQEPLSHRTEPMAGAKAQQLHWLFHAC